MKGVFSASRSTVRVRRAPPGHRRSPAARWGPVQPGAGPLAGWCRPRAQKRRGLEVKVPLVEPFTRPGTYPFAREVVDAELA
jgi:hypothetical protein